MKSPWKHVSLPAIAPDDTIITLDGGREHHWKKGEPLHPQRLSLERLDEICSAIGPDAAARWRHAETALDKRNRLYPATV